MRRVLFVYAMAAALVGAFAIALAQQQKPFIWGGVPAKDGEFPFQVGLVGPNAPYASCGGVLIEENWVLTAAHCLKNGKMLVKGGSRWLNSPKHPPRTIAEVREHPNFRPDPASQGARYVNDLALLRLDVPFKLDNLELARISLPENEGDEARLINGFPNYVAGWGLMDGSQHVLELNKAQVRPVDLNRCRGFHPGVEIRDTNLCAGDARQNHCLGDSGGAYVSGMGPNARLLGIISWGDACSLDRPGVHSRALSFKDWINGCVKGNCAAGNNTR